ncbi:hypothetical protein RDI58_017987 [Solanum bulbocastanum]|uniref:Uncharacterized protein n=1 Tax=Solanum bulbocastanum TaxID=147425 RepID=A0AAN8TG24_SOLBU
MPWKKINKNSSRTVSVFCRIFFSECLFLSLSKEHYNHLVSMLQQFQGGNIPDGSVADSIPTNRATNFAGPFTEEASGDW